MMKRKTMHVAMVACLMFAGVATAAPVLYELTMDDDVITGTITLDLDGAVPDESDGGVDTYIWSLNGDGEDSFNPAIVEASFNVADVPENFSTSEAWKLVVTLEMATSDNTPLSLHLDSDWGDDGGAPYLYTVQMIDFSTGEGAIDNPYGAAMTGAALTPGEALIDLQEEPADGSSVDENITDTLRWVLPDSNDVENGIVTCDVWFAAASDYTDGIYPGDPCFLDGATQIVGQISPEEVESVLIPVTLEADHIYYWRIDTYDDSTSEPQPVIGKVFIFDTNNVDPVVDLGSDVVDWRTEGILSLTLTGVVTDTDGPNPISHAWYIDDELVAGETAATIDLSLLLDNGEHQVRLEAYDGVDTGEDTVTIVVYEDSCEAVKGEGVEFLRSDINEDCVTDLKDFAILAAEWLVNTAL